MTNATSTLDNTANYDEFESQVRDAAHRGVESVNTWFESVWNKTLVILATAFPVPGDGMH